MGARGKPTLPLTQDTEMTLAEIYLMDFVEGRTAAIKAARQRFRKCSIDGL